MGKINKRKKFLFYVIIVLLTYLLSEVLSFTVYFFAEGEVFSFSMFQSYRRAIMNPDLFPLPPMGTIPIASIHSEVIHPYLGFVINPKEAEGYSEYGFRGKTTPFSPKRDDNLIIGMFGGSFAEEVALWGKDVLVNELKQFPPYADKEIIIHVIATGGYKQPQQVLALLYFLCLGAHFDLIINLDGFNEVALAPAENAGLVFPFYPRGWPARVGNFIDPEKLRLVAKLSFLSEQQRTWASFFATSLLRYNITANLFWRYYHIRLSNEQQSTAQTLERYNANRTNEFGYLATGPSFHYEHEADMFKDLARFWKQCSLHMHQLATANGVGYFHFLQPNQYVPGSKPMQEQELQVAFQADHLYRHGVVSGYPLLIQEGQDLIRQGVHFYDLTMIFAYNDEPLYSDNCCHLNAKGYQLISSTIGKTIVEDLQREHEDQ